jgi:hypothetical protein
MKNAVADRAEELPARLAFPQDVLLGLLTLLRKGNQNILHVHQFFLRHGFTLTENINCIMRLMTQASPSRDVASAALAIQL